MIGPLSVTLHLYLHPNGSLSSLNSSILSLHSLIRSSPALAARADIHLVVSPFPRAFNTWRNIARFLARTSYILLLDVDFAMCTAWRDPVRAMLQSGGEMAKRMREGRAALVLPAFEYARARDGKDQMLFPSNKQVSWYTITILAILLTYQYHLRAARLFSNKSIRTGFCLFMLPGRRVTTAPTTIDSTELNRGKYTGSPGTNPHTNPML